LFARRESADTLGRLLVLAALGALHAWVFAVPWRGRLPEHGEVLVSVWVQPIERQLRREVTAIPVLPQRLSSSVSTTHPTPQRSEPASDTPAAPREVDWRREGELAVDAAVADIVRNEGYRPLGPRETAGPRDEPPRPSIFEEPKHRSGDTGKNAFGDSVVWHNESCYTVLESALSTLGQHGVVRDGQYFCVAPVGKKEPRGDLFEPIMKQRERKPPANR
jgi:hypothetical protein